MTEEVDDLGQWWLPVHDELKVPGRFVWDRESGGELHLLGQLIPDEWEDHVLPGGSVQKVRTKRTEPGSLTYPVIHGQVGRRAFTLLDSYSLRRQERALGELALEDIHVNQLLESSAWFMDGDDLRFDRATVAMRHLTAWIGRSGINVEHPRFDRTSDLFSSISTESLPALDVVSDDGKVSFGQSLSETGDRLHSAGVSQRWDLHITFDTVQQIDAFIGIASDIQDLVSIAVGKTASFERVTVRHPEVPLRSLAGEPIGNVRDEILYRARWSNRSSEVEPVRTHGQFFNFDDFDGTDGVRRWMTVAQTYRTELGRVMATRYSAAMYLEDRVMNVCAALDSFDAVRRNAGSPTINFVDRIKESIAFAGDPLTQLLPANTDGWAKTVKEVRHDLAHHKVRFRQNAIQIDHLLSEQLYWLFVLCVLRLADTPDEVYASISKHPQFRWLREQANTTRP